MGFITVFKCTTDPAAPLLPIPGPTAPLSALGAPLRPAEAGQVWGGDVESTGLVVQTPGSQLHYAVSADGREKLRLH